MKEKIIYLILSLTVVVSFSGLIFSFMSLAKSESEFWQEAVMCASYKICQSQLSGEEGYQRWMKSIKFQ